MTKLSDLNDQELCEVVDAKNRLIACMSKESVLSQNLMSRSVALVIKDDIGHALFGLNDGYLTLPYYNYLPAGRSVTEYAEKILQDLVQVKTNHIVPLAEIRPNASQRQFITVLGLIVQGQELRKKAQKNKAYLWITPVELAGLEEYLAPEWDLMRYLYTAKILDKFLGRRVS